MERYKVEFSWLMPDGTASTSHGGTFTVETEEDAHECAMQTWYDPTLIEIGWHYAVNVEKE